MSIQRIRGSNTSLHVVIDGQPQGGSFSKVEGFNWKPLQEADESNFLGESESDFDIVHSGYELSFTTHEADGAAVENQLLPLVAKLKAGDTLPKVTLVFIVSYRDPSLPVKTYTFQAVRLVMGGYDAGDRKGFVKVSFSGKCQQMSLA